MSTMPTRVDLDLYEAAKSAGKLHSRSAAQQLGHWARLGRQLEGSPSLSHDAIARVLAGQMSYDDLADEREQAVVRTAWDERIDELRSTSDLPARLRATGKPLPESDADGNLVMRDPEADER